MPSDLTLELDAPHPSPDRSPGRAIRGMNENIKLEEIELEMRESLGTEVKILECEGEYYLICTQIPGWGMRNIKKLKTKVFDAEFILGKLRKEDARREDTKAKALEAAQKIKDYAQEKGLHHSINVCAYGLGIDNLFQDGRAKALELIDSLGIEYKRVEYSQARWVTRIIF